MIPGSTILGIYKYNTSGTAVCTGTIIDRACWEDVQVNVHVDKQCLLVVYRML